MSTEQPEFKQAKDIRAGDWLTFGPFCCQAGKPVVLDSGRIWIPIGYNGTECDPSERLRMHYPDIKETAR